MVLWTFYPLKCNFSSLESNFEIGLTAKFCSSVPSSDGESRTGSMTGVQKSGSSSLAMGTVLRRAANFFLLSRSRSIEPDVDVVDEFMSAIIAAEEPALVAMWGSKMSRDKIKIQNMS